jgi:predicted enzyme related to lactoylglutathione lyase
MDGRRVSALLFAGVLLGTTVFSTLQARQAADRAAFQSLQITLPVTDVGRSVDFYRTVLEFEPADVLPTRSSSGPGRAVFNVGGQNLALEQVLKEGQRPDGIRLVVHVTKPGEYAARLRARGAAVNTEFYGLDGQPLGFTVVDPDGYRFYFTGRVELARPSR